MSTIKIKKLMSECDELANSYYNTDSRDKERVARSWQLKVAEIAKLIKNESKKPTLNKKRGLKNNKCVFVCTLLRICVLVNH
jgi:hypothetical protein